MTPYRMMDINDITKGDLLLHKPSNMLVRVVGFRRTVKGPIFDGPSNPSQPTINTTHQPIARYVVFVEQHGDYRMGTGRPALFTYPPTEGDTDA